MLYLPAAIAHKGFSINRICSYMLLNSDGIFGVCMQVSATIIILFVIFGAFLWLAVKRWRRRS